GGPEGLDQSDQQSAENRAGQRADAAEYRGGERLYAGEEADEEIDHAVLQRHHQARDRGERRTDDEGERNGAVDVDAEQRRHDHILFAGALCAAERRQLDDGREHGHQEQRYANDDQLQPADVDRETAAPHQLEAAGDQRRQRLLVRALDEEDVVLQEDRHADCRNQRRQTERAAQPTIGDAFDGPAVDRRERHGDQQHQRQRQRNPGNAERSEHDEENQRNERA